MKIGFDISQIAYHGGVATYTENLSKELVKIPKLDMHFFYSSMRVPYHGSLPNVKRLPLPPTLTEFLFNSMRVFPIENIIGQVDIFHSSDWMQPPAKAKKVTTYHDVVPIKYPEWSTPKIIDVHRRRLKIVEKEIDMVIAVSESTKKDLLEISSIPEDKIVVIYEAQGENFSVQSEDKVFEFKKRFNLPDHFVLGVGGIGKRRNLESVKKACGKEFDLIISGENFPWVEYKDLPLLYSSADVLLYLSFYEGFGLPILEAMACGVPVITSNTSSMPEVGGNAALYVDPYDIDEISKKLKEVMSSKDLRQKMSKEGLKWVNNFSWKKTAEKTVQVYNNLLS